jgi:thioredoxin-related protein
MFETEDCPWCLRMKLQVLNRVSVQDYYHEHFRILSLDVEGDVLITDFAGNEVTSKEFSLKALRVRATPVFAFFDQNGELITRYTGALKNAHDFLLLGRYVVDGHYRDTRFSRFRRDNQPG